MDQPKSDRGEVLGGKEENASSNCKRACGAEYERWLGNSRQPPLFGKRPCWLLILTSTIPLREFDGFTMSRFTTHPSSLSQNLRAPRAHLYHIPGQLSFQGVLCHGAMRPKQSHRRRDVDVQRAHSRPSFGVRQSRARMYPF